MTRQTDALHIQIAREVFGWQWRDDWHAWYPPGWPSREVVNAPYMDKIHALKQHGGAPYGHSGGIDSDGRPVVPQYQYDPEAAWLLWQWLHAQPEVPEVRLQPLPIPPGSLRGVKPWRCEIASDDTLRKGEGDGHQAALCRGVLAWVRTQRQSTIGRGTPHA